MPHITIAIGLRENNLIPALVSIKSILTATRNKQALSFAIFHDGINESMTNLMKMVLSSFEVEFSLINMPRILSGFTYKDIICEYLLYPLLIPQYFTTRDFILSIGAGSLVRGDVLSLLEQFPTDKKIGAVHCMYHAHTDLDRFHNLTDTARTVLHMENTDRYFSRNLLLFNRKTISTEESQACIQLLDEAWHTKDEAILNYLFQNSLHLFPQQWNFQMPLFSEPNEAFAPSCRQAIAESRHDIKLGQFSSFLNPDDMDAALKQTNNLVREYKKTALVIMKTIQNTLGPSLFDPMWTKLEKII
ncbi:hypothetical protein J3T99_08830 [Acetobacteraceae bacterium B3987]|nr:hypothetical protein [Acetobacteraceae bacterium B3987]